VDRACIWKDGLFILWDEVFCHTDETFIWSAGAFRRALERAIRSDEHLCRARERAIRSDERLCRAQERAIRWDERPILQAQQLCQPQTQLPRPRKPLSPPDIRTLHPAPKGPAKMSQLFVMA
jgi:hypothetical protein